MENSKAAESRNLGVRVRTTRRGEKGGWLAKDCEGFTIDSKEALSVVCIPNERLFCAPVPFMGGMKTVCLSRSQNYSATIRSRTVYGPELWPRLWLMEDEWKSETMDFELVSRAWKIFHKALPSCLINPFQQYIFRRNIVANVWPVSRRYLSESKISPIPIFWFEEMIEWSNLFGYLLNSN